MDRHPIAGYVPGPWTGIVGPHVVLLAEFDPTGAAASACWEAIERGAGADAILGVIVREGLRNVPSFGLLTRDDAGVRVLVSGKARARVAGQHTEVLSAAESPTWLERTVGATAAVRLLAGAVAADEVPSLPVGAGIVLAGALELTQAPAPDGAAATAAPATPAKPVGAGLGEPVASEAPEEQAPAPSFDHLFGSTVEPASLVEASARREPARHEATPVPTDTMMPVPTDTMAPAPPTGAAAARSAEPSPPLVDPGSGVIESLPWQLPDAFRAVGSAPAHPAPQAPAAPVPHPPEPAAPPPAPAFPAAPAQAPPVPLPEPAAPMVAATACPNRHLGPPQAGTCRVCGAAIAQQEPFNVPRPVLGVLSLSTGDMVPLDRDVILGRAPTSTDDDPHSRPHLVQLASPDNDISRNHVRVSLEGWHVLVIDLGSTNGTVVTLPGQQPVRLRPHDPFTIVAGTIVTIADEVSLRFDVHQ